jgi:RHS repeat-associated protein
VITAQRTLSVVDQTAFKDPVWNAGNGRERTKEYDSKGRLTRELGAKGDDASGALTNRRWLKKYEYYSSGQLRKIAEGTAAANGTEEKTTRSVEYVYDAWTGAQTEARFSDGRRIAKTYLPDGRTDGVDIFEGSLRVYWKQYAYNPPSGLVSRITTPEGTLEFEHDDYGQVSRIRTSTGQDYEYTYNAVGNLQYIYSRGLPGAPDQVVQYSYDQQGRRTLVRFSNGTETAYTYDAFGRAATIWHRKTSDQSNLLRLTYTRDRRGLIKQLVGERTSSTVTSNYWYDHQKRLTDERRVGSTTVWYRYTYDGAGNRLSEKVDEDTTTYTYNSLGQLLSDGTFAYQYDTFGNLFRKLQGGLVKETYTFDGANCLRRMANDTGQVVYLSYDEQNTRIGKRFQFGATDQTTCYLMDFENPTGLSQTLAEYNPSDPTSMCAYVYGTELLAQADGSHSAAFFHTDHLGSTRLLTDTSGSAIVGSDFSYKPYGELAGGNGSLTSYAFTGQYRDPNLNLQYHRARWLNTELGSWLSLDKYFDLPNFGNLYLYAGANSVNTIDLTGLYATMGEIGAVQNISSNLRATEVTIRVEAITRITLPAEIGGVASSASAFSTALRMGAWAILLAHAGIIATAIISQIFEELLSQPSPEETPFPLGQPVDLTQTTVQKTQDATKKRGRFFLVHFTNEAGYASISRSMQISPSLRYAGRQGVFLAPVEYLSLKSENIAHLLFGSMRGPTAVTHYFLINGFFRESSG